MSEVPLYGDAHTLPEPTSLENARFSNCNFIENEFQSKTLMQLSLLHECFNITGKDHAMQ